MTRPFVPPSGDVEPVVAQIWSELLRVERVGRNDDFFALGGHSLLAMQAIARIRTRFSIRMPVRTLFEPPMLSAFVARFRRYAGRSCWKSWKQGTLGQRGFSRAFK